MEPYSDDYMIFDERTGHYVLTEQYAYEVLGIELNEEVNGRGSANDQIAVGRILKQVSLMIYNYIHSFSVYNDYQDCVIASCESARKMIMDAMGEQLLYMAQVGDLSRSTDAEKRNMAIDETAKQILLCTLPEIGTTILYCGVH